MKSRVRLRQRRLRPLSRRADSRAHATLLALFDQIVGNPEQLPAVPIEGFPDGSAERKLLSGFGAALEQIARNRRTDRKMSETRLRQKEEQYRGIFEATGDGLAINRLDGVLVEVNPAFTNRSGSTTTVEFHWTAFNGTDLDTKGVVVHELGHAWNYASGGRLMEEFMGAVGSRNGWKVVACGVPAHLCPAYGYIPGEEKPIRDYGFRNADEDFADSVAAAVYPESYHAPDRPGVRAAVKRVKFVEDQFLGAASSKNGR